MDITIVIITIVITTITTISSTTAPRRKTSFKYVHLCYSLEVGILHWPLANSEDSKVQSHSYPGFQTILEVQIGIEVGWTLGKVSPRVVTFC